MTPKPSSRAKSDFEFYRTTPLDMIGRVIGADLVSDPEGFSALECWYALDTHGRTLPCSEPELLSKVTRSKQSVNLQVKLWAEDLAGGLLTQAELIDYTHGWPEWVLRAVTEQAGRLALRTVGFVPRFVRAEYVAGRLWLPELDWFDPSI